MRHHLPLAAAAVLLLLAPALAAGPLNPPNGPVSSTHKTLSDIEPSTPISAATTPGGASSLFSIIHPGTYHLTGNVAGVAGKHGIQIHSHSVTIDLRGFELAGVPGSLSGIFSSLQNHIVIHSGDIRHWGRSGIELHPGTASSASTRVTDVRCWGNLENGFMLPSNSIATRCTGVGNAAYGISGLESTFLDSCTARGNSAGGIFLINGGTALSCTSIGNGGDGFQVTGSVIRSCTARNNFGNGITASFGCVVEGNFCIGNGVDGSSGAGIRVLGAGSRVEGNHTRLNDRGFEIIGTQNLVIRNSASGNTTEYVIGAGNTVGLFVSSINITTSNNPHANYDH